jgi:hypothetical protein
MSLHAATLSASIVDGVATAKDKEIREGVFGLLKPTELKGLWKYFTGITLDIFWLIFDPRNHWTVTKTTWPPTKRKAPRKQKVESHPCSFSPQQIGRYPQPSGPTKILPVISHLFRVNQSKKKQPKKRRRESNSNFRYLAQPDNPTVTSIRTGTTTNRQPLKVEASLRIGSGADTFWNFGDPTLKHSQRGKRKAAGWGCVKGIGEPVKEVVLIVDAKVTWWDTNKIKITIETYTLNSTGFLLGPLNRIQDNT